MQKAISLKSDSVSTSNAYSAKAKVSTAVALGITLIGTGSAYFVGNVGLWERHVQARTQLQISGAADVRVSSAKITTSILLDEIRRLLFPSVTELARWLSVSRQAVYKWMAKESEPDEGNLNKIRRLYQIASAVKEHDLTSPAKAVRMNQKSNGSVLDLAKEEYMDLRKVNELLAASKKVENAYRSSAVRSSKTAPNDNWLSSTSFRDMPE